MGTPIISPKSPLTGGLAPASAGTITASKMSRIELPQSMDLKSLMDWLTKKMAKSDTDIRAKMSTMNDRKEIQDALNKLTSDFRMARTAADTGGGYIDVSSLEDPASIKASAWYGALDSGTRDKIDTMLSHIHAPCYRSDFEKFTYPGADGALIEVGKGHVFSEADVAKHSIDTSTLTVIPERMHKDKFEDVLQSLGDITKTLSSSDEIEMIELQSTISARGQLLQMISNMIASFNETSKNIVGNVRG